MRLLPLLLVTGCFWLDTTDVPCETDDNCPYDTTCEVEVDEETGLRHCSAYNPFAIPNAPNADGPAFTAYTWEIDAGADHTCALREDDTIACWGANDHGQSDPPAGRFESLACGRWYCCAKPSSGSLSCWGDAGSRGEPDDDPTLSSVAIGSNHVCALRQGVPRCWGDNEHGQLDVSSVTQRDVAVALDSTCTLSTGGGVACTGTGPQGASMAYEGDSEFMLLDGGSTNYCGITEGGQLECFSGGWYGWTEPLPPTSDNGFVQLDVAYGYACAVDREGAGFCWGPDCTGDDCEMPEGPWSVLTAGRYHTCGLRPTGQIECWGDNRDGRLSVP